MKSWYRPIDAGMWGDEKFRKLSRPNPCGQFLWIYLLTGDHAEGLPGLYIIGEAALAEALGWSVEELRVAIHELETLGMALADFNARVIYLPNALRYQGPDNSKQLKSWDKAFRRIPECELKNLWLQKLTEFAENKGKPYIEALCKGFDRVCNSKSDRVSPPNPNPKPNPKPNPNPNNLKAELPGNLGGTDEPSQEIPYATIVGLLNEKSGKRFRHGTPATKRHIDARWREGHRLDDFEAVITAKCSQWLGTDMEKYLRPQTLLGPKFEGYLNEHPLGQPGGASLYPDMDELMEAGNGN